MYNTISITNFNIDIFAPDCSVPMAYQTKWFLKLSIPFMIIGTFIGVFVFQKILVLFSKNIGLCNEYLKDFHGIPPKRFVYSVSLILIWTYTLLCSTIFQPLKCTQQSDGTWYMDASTSTICFDAQYHRVWTPWIIILSLFYIAGIPLVIGIILYLNRNRLRNKRFLDHFGAITLPYRDQFFWFELVNLGRKACIVVLIDFFYILSTQYLQIFIMLAALFGFLMAQMTLSPYRLHINNFLGFTWIIVSVFCLFSGIVFPNNAVGDNEKLFFERMVITIFASGCGFSCYAFFIEQKLVLSLKSQGLIYIQSYLSKWEKHMAHISRMFPKSRNMICDVLSLSTVAQQETIFKEFEHLDSMHESRRPSLSDLTEPKKVKWTTRDPNMSFDAFVHTDHLLGVPTEADLTNLSVSEAPLAEGIQDVDSSE